MRLPGSACRAERISPTFSVFLRLSSATCASASLGIDSSNSNDIALQRRPRLICSALSKRDTGCRRRLLHARRNDQPRDQRECRHDPQCPAQARGPFSKTSPAHAWRLSCRGTIGCLRPRESADPVSATSTSPPQHSLYGTLPARLSPWSLFSCGLAARFLVLHIGSRTLAICSGALVARDVVRPTDRL